MVYVFIIYYYFHCVYCLHWRDKDIAISTMTSRQCLCKALHFIFMSNTVRPQTCQRTAELLPLCNNINMLSGRLCFKSYIIVYNRNMVLLKKIK